MTATTSSDLRVEARPTQTDPQLMLQLAQLGQTPLMERGQSLLWKSRKTGGLTVEQLEREHDVESEDYAAVVAVLKWHETIGTLVKQGLLDRGLVLDWLWVSGTWDLCKDIALGQRPRWACRRCGRTSRRWRRCSRTEPAVSPAA